MIMRFRIELIPDLTVYTISDWFHATFQRFHLKGMRCIGMEPFRVNRSPIWYETNPM